MTLTKEERETLIKRYEMWGVDWVRAQLQRGDHELLVTPEVTALARDWLEKKDNESQRLGRRLVWLGLSSVCVATFVVAISIIV